jgi:hypothetical protein
MEGLDIHVLTQIQWDYLEMPDMKLTLSQAQRLWQLPVDVCDGAFRLLVDRGFLVRARDGGFVRRGAMHHPADPHMGVF